MKNPQLATITICKGWGKKEICIYVNDHRIYGGKPDPTCNNLIAEGTFNFEDIIPHGYKLVKA